MFGQSSSKGDINHRLWGIVGFGTAVGSKIWGSAFGASLNYFNTQNLYSIRYTRFQNLSHAVPGNDPSQFSPIKKVAEGSVLYGKCEKKNNHLVAASVGLGFLQNNIWTFAGDKTITEVGIAFQIQAFWNPSPYWGIGFYGFGNVNREKNLYGILICLEAGIL